MVILIFSNLSDRGLVSNVCLLKIVVMFLLRKSQKSIFFLLLSFVAIFVSCEIVSVWRCRQVGLSLTRLKQGTSLYNATRQLERQCWIYHHRSRTKHQLTGFIFHELCKLNNKLCVGQVCHLDAEVGTSKKVILLKKKRFRKFNVCLKHLRPTG